MSPRVSTQYEEIAYLVQRFQLDATDVLSMQKRLRADSTLTERTVACEWVKANRRIWMDPRTGWLLKPPTFPSILHVVPWVCLTTAFVLALSWCTYPIWGSRPEVGSPWYACANWLRPKLIVFLIFNFGTAIYLLGLNIYDLRQSCKMWYKSFSERRKARVEESKKRTRVLASVVPGDSPSITKSLHRSSTESLNGNTHSLTRRHSLAKQSRSNRRKARKMERDKAAKALQFENEDLEDRNGDVAAALVQGLFRTKGNMAAARVFRATMKATVAEGAQFAQRDTWGLEGTTFLVGVVRSRHCASNPLHLMVHGIDGTAAEGRDFMIIDDTVFFEAGETFKSIRVELLYNGVSAQASSQRAWLPVRDCKLRLQVIAEEASWSKHSYLDWTTQHVRPEDCRL